MKIYLRAGLLPEIEEAIKKKDKLLGEKFYSETSVYEFDTDTDIWDRIVAVAKNIRSLSIYARMEFDKKELHQARFFTVDCRGKVIYPSETVNDINLKYLMEKTAYIQTGKYTRIKIPDRLVLSKVAVKPGIIASPDMAGYNDYALPLNVAEIFKNAGLTGYETRPILHPKTGIANQDAVMLYTNKIAPPAQRDISIIFRGSTVDLGYHNACFMGCVTYDFKENIEIFDFNRTAEPVTGWGCPWWVISAKTKECYDKNKIKGWAFRPVLEKGSPLHEEYIKKWEDVYHRVMVNPKNTID
jgi:hypothetical protein